MAMHMVLVIGGEVVLLGLFLLFGRLWDGAASDFALGAKLFVPVWALIALANLWVGVTRAGYSVREELPTIRQPHSEGLTRCGCPLCEVLRQILSAQLGAWGTCRSP